MAVKKQKCKFKLVNGDKTAVFTRKGMSASTTAIGTLVHDELPNGVFYVDLNDGGTNDYYKLIDPQLYKVPNTPQYVYCGTEYVTMVGSASTTDTNTDSNKQNTTDKVTDKTKGVTNTTTNANDSEMDEILIESLRSTQNYYGYLKNHRFIFGSPFQFLDETDYRPFMEKNKVIRLGRKYAENILSEAPIVDFVPGSPRYLPDFDNDSKAAITEILKENNVSEKIRESFLNEEGRYFNFVANFAEYIQYVNLLCRMTAIYMGLKDKIVPTEANLSGDNRTTYAHYNWANYAIYNTRAKPSAEKKRDKAIKKSKDGIWDATEAEEAKGLFDYISEIGEDAVASIEDFLGDMRAIRFYVDPSSSFSESISNNTQASSIAGLFDTAEGVMKEIQFFVGDGKSVSGSILSGLQNATSSLLQGGSDLVGNGGLKKMLGMGSKIVSGSNVIFPEIWGDASYTKSYNFTMNFVSPYGDAESVYLNCMVPLMHILALALPKQTSANSFTSPPLVKVAAPGRFSCDLGMIDSLTIEKGGSGDGWNIAGLPTEIRVSVGVRDLYTNLMITKSSKPGLYFNNQGLIDFLAVSCGVDIIAPNIELKIATIKDTLLSTIFDIPENVEQGISQMIRNTIQAIFTL